MRRYLGIGVAWVGATVLSVVIASAAVAGIRDRVVETPVAIGLPTTTVTTVPLAIDPPLTVPETTATTPAPTITVTTTTTAPPPTETTVIIATTTPPVTTTTTSTTTTTTTTAPTQTTTTQPLTYSTYELTGGTVTLSFGNGEVHVVTAVPRPGFSYEAEHTGPVEVEVKFTSNDHKSKLEARVDNGELKVSTEEESHGDGD